MVIKYLILVVQGNLRKNMGNYSIGLTGSSDMQKYLIGAVFGVLGGALISTVWPLGLLLVVVILVAAALLVAPEHTSYRKY